ncbi:MAG: CopG family transcriptional regulator [Actinomycetia bacterium]|nr:CopG family transcriptional regulator [Actinomycetes bacterium]
MRTTIDLDEDVRLAVERLRAERGLGLSEAVNTLARAGLKPPARERYVHRGAKLGLRVDVANVGEVLDLLDGR